MTSRIDRRPRLATAPTGREVKSRKSGLGGTLLGLFIGIALGLALAAGVAYYITKSGNPYQATSPARESAREPARDATRPSRGESSTAEKPRFDFYKILPGGEEPKVQPRADRATADRATADRSASGEKAVAKLDDRPAPATDKAAAKSSERYWLQAGSFASESDAQNLKARLAFAGLVATVQPATLPDKGTRYRVRLGPYDNTEELTRMKSEIGARGFEVSVIRN